MRQLELALLFGAMDEKAPISESINVNVDLPARDGAYNREVCNVRMEKDTKESKKNGTGEQAPIK